MKKSSSKKRGNSSNEVRQKKRVKNSSHSKKSLKSKDKVKVPRKTRWEDVETVSADKAAKQEAPPATPVVLEKKEKSEGTSRIEALLNEKEKIIEHLFLTISGTALEEIIPDYLKKIPTEELKKLCADELSKMSKNDILYVISGKDPTFLKEQEPQAYVKDGDPQQIKVASETNESTDIASYNSPDTNTPTSCELLELCATGQEEGCGDDDENRAPEEVLEKVAKDLGLSEGDADLLELEMRARAIRSLLKLKSQDESELEIPDMQD